MQREIRFRGKATGMGNTPANWVYGGGCVTVNGHTFIIPDIAPKFTGKSMYETKAIEVCYLCQYTGLRDVNGKEVYGGDVVRLYGNGNYAYTVEWNKAVSAFLARCTRTIGLANLTEETPIEVIGNIYDNPNLLKGENR